MKRRSVDGGLRAEWRRHLKDVHWQSVETPLTGGGVPDMNYCVDSVEGWIENKWTDGWEVPLRPLQVGWACRRARAGGRVIIAVRRQCAAGRLRPAADELWLLAGWAARELATGGLRYALEDAQAVTGASAGMLLGMWPGGPERWSWDAVRRVLLTAPHRPPFTGRAAPRG